MSHAANPNKPKRDKVESEAAIAAKQEKVDRERIRRLIITLGDDNKKVIGQIKGLVGALEDDIELHGDLIAETVIECAKNLPLKTSIYSAWIARMVEKHASWAASIVTRIMDDIRTALRVGSQTLAQLLLRFLVSLGNTGVIGLSQVLMLIQEVLALSEGLRPAKGGDLGVFLALAALPFLSPSAHAMIAANVDAILATAQTYLAARDARWKPLLRVLKSDNLLDRLEALAAAVLALKQSGWSSHAVLHVPGFEPKMDGCPDMPSLTPLGVVAEDIRKSKVRMQVPLSSCRLLSARLENDGADDHMSAHDRWILEDYILTTIEMFGRDVEECSKQILRIPVLHPHFDAIAVETVISSMLRLPSPALLPLFYSRLIEALTEKQNSMLKLVEQAYVALFERASDLDEDCLEILADAFAYHLMHNGYSADLSPFTGDSVPVQAQRLLRRLLERLQRLSFHQNLLHRLPEAVHVYVPPEPLAANNLPAQSKPEFARMLGFVRIKEPDEKKVIQYCHRLLKFKPKEEQKQEDPRASEAGTSMCAAVMPPKEACEIGKEKLPPSVEEGDKPSGDQGTDAQGEGDKRSREEPEETAAEDAPASKRLRSEGSKQGTESAVEEPEGEPTAVEVKEEVKQEDERGAGGAGVALASEVKIEGVAKVDEDDELGDVPAKPWSLESVVELFVIAVLQNGAKTPTHMSKLLDGHQQVFVKLRPADEEEAHGYMVVIVRCMFEFWRLSGQRLEITLDALLHRGVVTQRVVIEQALAQRGPTGCDSMSVWNIINSVARKSLEHSQSVRVELAIAKKLGKSDVLERCRRQLDTAVQDTAELFTLIFTGLVRNHQDFEDRDLFMRKITLERVLAIGRKYHAFIKPLVDAAESRIPGVAHNPDIAAVFHSLRTL